MNRKQKLIVIGNGMAGARLLEEVVAHGGLDQFDLIVFGDEPYGNYNRILLSGVLAGDHEPDEIFLNPLKWYHDNHVTLHAGVRVDSIDRELKIVHGSDGVSESYDHLIFATGSKPFIPPMGGLYSPAVDSTAGSAEKFKEGVFVFRTLDDSLRMIERSASSRSAVVIGGGLLGLEAARGLHGRGLKVHVIELMPHPMEVQLDSESGVILRQTLERMGIRFHLGTAATEVIGSMAVEGVVLRDGTTVPCDMLVISAGIRANSELAKQAGLAVERGIVVGDDMASISDTSIYAIGECAQHRGRVYGLVAPAWEQGRVLAERLTQFNRESIYEGSNTSTKLKVMGVELLVLGIKNAASEQDEVVTFAEPKRGIYKKLIVRDGRLAGAILLGDALAGSRLLQAFHGNEILPDNRGDLLFPPAMAGGTISVTNEPDTFQICNCNGVTKGKILSAVKAGARSVKSLCEMTRAGTGCGSCKPLVQTLFESACDNPVADDPSYHYYVPGVPLTKPELIRAITEQQLKSVSAVFETLVHGEEDAKSKAGLASLLKTIWKDEYDDERDARFINDRVHANIQKDGTFSVVPRIFGGVTTPAQLRTIADVAEKYNVPMVKITGGQRIDLLGIPKEKLPDVWKDLGMTSGHAYTKSVRTVKTCVGEEFCRYGVGDSTTLGIQIEKRFQGIEAPHKIKMAVSGCPRNCAESTTKDVGVVAIEGGRWEVYVGGASGSRVRKGDVLCTMDSHEGVLQFVGRFIQYYREQGKYLERTYDFVERIGIEKLKAILIDNAEHIVQRLEDEMDRAVQAFTDPWEEGNSPIHPLQFANALTPAGATEIRGTLK